MCPRLAAILAIVRAPRRTLIVFVPSKRASPPRSIAKEIRGVPSLASGTSAFLLGVAEALDEQREPDQHRPVVGRVEGDGVDVETDDGCVVGEHHQLVT